jgi:hypothetical protein
MAHGEPNPARLTQHVVGMGYGLGDGQLAPDIGGY